MPDAQTLLTVSEPTWSRHADAERDLARGDVPDAGLDDLAEDHVLEGVRGDAGALQRSARCDLSERHGRHVRQAAADLSEGGAGGTQHDRCHRGRTVALARSLEPASPHPLVRPPLPPLPLGSWQRRLGAGTLDIALWIAGAAAAAGALTLVARDAIAIPAGLLIAWAVLCLVPTALSGRTLGKLAAGLRTVAADGSRLGARRALMREGVGRLLVEMPLLFAAGAGLLSYFWPIRDERRRTWHDCLGWSAVVRTR